MLLDTCSTDFVFRNNNFLSNVRECKHDDILHITSNGGSISYDTIGIFDMLELPVYYNKDSLANVLSSKYIASMQGARVNIDTAVEKTIMVQTNNHSFKFK